jgi:hypothetical protein
LRLAVDTIYQYTTNTQADARAAFVLTDYWVLIDALIAIIIYAITYFRIFTRSAWAMDYLPLIT